ncbi:hypothetical protein GGI18_000932 [Coemansia linderi]|uniref:Uncharacterized protein n=1 Tax=Coemansia linderi TaxID=2663919 RepID=A0ACC1KL92_9FUNG|nr:hypothetical protein GGI18_000932 [Coemansia linderi]
MGAVTTSSTFFRDIAWRIVNIVVAALWIVAAGFMFSDKHFQTVMPGLFLLVVGVASIVFEFWRPVDIVDNCRFLWNFLGRGVLSFRVVTYVAAGFSWFFGIVYIVLWFTSFTTLFPVGSPAAPYPEQYV